MIAADIIDAVAAQEIEVSVSIEIVEVSPLCTGVDVIEADDPLHLHEGGIQVARVQVVVFTEARCDEALQVERHGEDVTHRTACGERLSCGNFDREDAKSAKAQKELATQENFSSPTFAFFASSRLISPCRRAPPGISLAAGEIAP
jgi:hypothetical protein